MEGHPETFIHDGSLLPQHPESNMNAANENHPGLIVFNGALFHQHPHQSENINVNSGVDAQAPPDQVQHDEDEVMSHSFEGESDTDTIIPVSQQDAADYVIEDNGATPGPSSGTAHAREETAAIRYGKRIRHSANQPAYRPGLERGAAKFRAGQRVLLTQLRARTAQLALARENVRAELVTDFHSHVANVDAEAQARENALMAEWVNSE